MIISNLKGIDKEIVCKTAAQVMKARLQTSVKNNLNT